MTVSVIADRLVGLGAARRAVLQPLHVVDVQAPFAISDEDVDGDMPGICERRRIISHMSSCALTPGPIVVGAASCGTAMGGSREWWYDFPQASNSVVNVLAPDFEILL